VSADILSVVPESPVGRGRVRRALPPAVLEAPPHCLVVFPTEQAVQLYVREDEFTLARYPARCPVELALADFDNGEAMCVVLLVRLARRNASTFERFLNVADPNELRVLKLLSTQRTVDVFLVSECVRRSFRVKNGLAGPAAGLIAALRRRRSWEPEAFLAWRRRLDTLYPTPEALWRSIRRRRK
jgi:hypothetical protein